MNLSSQNVDGLLYDLGVAGFRRPVHEHPAVNLLLRYRVTESPCPAVAQEPYYGGYAFVAFDRAAHQSRYCAQ